MNINEIFETAIEEDPFDSFTNEEKEIIKIKAELAMAVRHKRAELNMNQAAFADSIGVSQSAVSKWESGEHNLSINTLSKILAKLDMTIQIVPNNGSDDLPVYNPSTVSNGTTTVITVAYPVPIFSEQKNIA